MDLLEDLIMVAEERDGDRVVTWSQLLTELRRIKRWNTP